MAGRERRYEVRVNVADIEAARVALGLPDGTAISAVFRAALVRVAGQIDLSEAVASPMGRPRKTAA